ncbi:MAG: FAD-binding oxidoreductase, partial [Halobacteria archaeon]|nr:FAD-binding oxidoreductase [Halobacteria archaeon]
TQCVVLEPTEPLRDNFPLGRVSSKGLYFRPEHNGDLLVGGGWHPEERPERAGGKADGEFRNYVAETLPSVIRGTENARFINDWAGVDTATPDTKPVIDRIPNGPDGILVATGFNGLGVMMSPIAGAVTRSLLTGGSPTFQTQIFKGVSALI